LIKSTKPPTGSKNTKYAA
jgi:hypothetical protein